MQSCKRPASLYCINAVVSDMIQNHMFVCLFVCHISFVMLQLVSIPTVHHTPTLEYYSHLYIQTVSQSYSNSVIPDVSHLDFSLAAAEGERTWKPWHCDLTTTITDHAFLISLYRCLD